MDEHVAFVPLSPQPRPTNSTPFALPTLWNFPASLAQQQVAPDTENGHSFNNDDRIRDLVSQITDHPNFDTLFCCIESILQLENLTWTSFFELRRDTSAKLKLERWHSSVWHMPPEDVWTTIVQLRQQPNFTRLQSQILIVIGNVYHENRGLASVGGMCTDSQGALWVASMARPNVSAPLVHAQTPRTLFAPSGVGQQPLRPPSDWRTATSLLPPQFVPHESTSPVQKHRSRQAPEGYSYYCPSEGCPRFFRRPAHYQKHLTKTHPDFGPRHPNHSPSKSLRPRTSSSTSNEHIGNTVHFGALPAFSQEHGTGGSRAFAASRRGSHPSLSSFGASSSAIDDSAEDLFAGPSRVPDTNLPMMDESSIRYVGGGMSMSGMSHEGLAGYYGSMVDQ